MSKRPTVIANDRPALSVWPFFYLGCVLLFLWGSWSTRQLEGVLFAVGAAGASGFYFVQAARWKRMHLARQRAVSEGIHAGVPLARPQPIPNAQALPTPFTILLRPHWLHLLASMLLGEPGSSCFTAFFLGNRLTCGRTDPIPSSLRSCSPRWFLGGTAYPSASLCMRMGWWCSIRSMMGLAIAGLAIPTGCATRSIYRRK